SGLRAETRSDSYRCAVPGPRRGSSMKGRKTISSKQFDAAFDAGDDVSTHLDTRKARRPGLEQQRLSVDAPAWMVERLDREAGRLGITRQSLIKVWLAERLEKVA